MKIVSFFESIQIGGGVEKVQANLSIGFTDLGYNFTNLVLEDKTPRNNYKGRIVSLNEKFIFGFGIKKIILLIKLSYKVSKYCTKEKIDIIIGQGDFFYMIISISKIFFGNKSKCIGVIHTTIGIWPNYIKKILLLLLNKLDKVILISNEEYNIFIKKYGFNKDKLKIIDNSIDLDEVKNKLKEELNNQHNLIFNKNKFTFINVGRLTYQKNQKLLLKAFDLVNQEFTNTQLIIVGEGELKKELLELKNSLISKENIYFLGNQKNIYPFLKKSNCFVLSSLFEGFGLVLLEAMSAGLPIISTNCPSGPSEILNGKNNIINLEITKNAILVPYINDNKKLLIDSMKKIYIDEKLKRKLSLNNLKRVEDFNKNTILNEWNYLVKSFNKDFLNQ